MMLLSFKYTFCENEIMFIVCLLMNKLHQRKCECFVVGYVFALVLDVSSLNAHIAFQTEFITYSFQSCYLCLNFVLDKVKNNTLFSGSNHPPLVE